MTYKAKLAVFWEKECPVCISLVAEGCYSQGCEYKLNCQQSNHVVSECTSVTPLFIVTYFCQVNFTYWWQTYNGNDDDNNNSNCFVMQCLKYLCPFICIYLDVFSIPGLCHCQVLIDLQNQLLFSVCQSISEMGYGLL